MAALEALPGEGRLFQYDADATDELGDEITLSNRIVTDLQNRFVFVPYGTGTPDTDSFSFIFTTLIDEDNEWSGASPITTLSSITLEFTDTYAEILEADGVDIFVDINAC